MIELSKDERIDDTGFADIRVIQDPKEFCYGIDAVLLSAFVAGETGTKSYKLNRVMDLGTGTGIIPFILSHKMKISHILGIEKQRASFERAIKGLELNHIETIEFHNLDILQIKDNAFGKFDAVTCNPPYKKKDSGIKNNSEAKFIARNETSATLEDFIRIAAENLKNRGHLYMVHRPSRLSNIIYFMKSNNIEPSELQFVSPRQGEAPNIMLIHGIKGGKNDVNVLKELHVYEGECYDKEILRIYERLD